MINKVAESIAEALEQRRELNRSYGVPMYTKKEIDDLVKWAAEGCRVSADEIFDGLARHGFQIDQVR